MPKELAGYMAMFRSLFPRSETFKNACAYVVGLLSNLPRKNGETMAAAIGSVANKQAVHRFLTTSPWLAEELDRLRVAHAVSVAATGTDGMLIVDEVSQLKQGSSSVGVKRQYLGCVGKTANGQVVVSVHYCDPRFDWPVTGRVFVKRKVGHSVHRKLGHPFCHGFYSHPFVWPDGARGTGRLIAYRDRRAGPRKGKFGRRPHHGVKAAAA
jgi:SRSO17 transposase